jgi:hypothetical protein
MNNQHDRTGKVGRPRLPDNSLRRYWRKAKQKQLQKQKEKQQ